jgi:hypothetical protein
MLLLNACVTVPFGSKLLASQPARALDAEATALELPPIPPGFRQVRGSNSSFMVPDVWKEPTVDLAGTKPGPWIDTVNGPIAESIAVSTCPTDLTSLDQLGQVSALPLKRIGFDDLARADLVAAVRRQGSGDGVNETPYFDYDLAVSPQSCARDQEIVPGACLPTRVVLLSCAVRAGQLHALRIEVSPDQWRKAGTTLRNVRSSFTVD